MAGLVQDTDFAALSETKKHDAEVEKLHTISSESTSELDGIHDGLEFPTDEERATLRRVSDTLPWSAYCSLPHSDTSQCRF